MVTSKKNESLMKGLLEKMDQRARERAIMRTTDRLSFPDLDVKRTNKSTRPKDIQAAIRHRLMSRK